MTRSTFAFTLLLFATFGCACGSDSLKTKNTDGSATGGQAGTSASGGVTGLAGAGAGGNTIVGSGGANAGGSATGGKGGSNAGGSTTGGKGGANTGGSATGGRGGTSGTTCPPVMCPAIACLNGTLPNPDPCGCPICALPDAGTAKDATADACIALPCAYPLCAPGYIVMDIPCGCPRCVPVDAGQPDAVSDTGTDTSRLDCVGLDECTCFKTNGCMSVSEACYCPFPTCSTAGACVCGGGRFLGCAPSNLTTCAAAQARVSALCPSLKGTTYSGLCQQNASACITKCLNEVTSCSDIACTACDGCDCAGDRFSACVSVCKTIN
jgi:hypothetical protein